MSNLTSFEWFAVLLAKSCPFNGITFGSISVSLHISNRIFDVRSSKLLCLIVAKTLLPRGHVDGKFEISQSYLKLIDS